MLSRSIKAAFGGPFLALLRNQAAGVWTVAQGDRQHLICGGHFQVERQVRLSSQAIYVGVADMAAVFAQMRGNAIRARLGGDTRGSDRIWMRPAARITDRRDVVDVHAKTEVLPLGHSQSSLRVSLTI